MATGTVKSLVSTLNSKITQVRVTLEAGESGITKDGYLIYTPATKTVRVYGTAISSDNITAAMSVATIPTGYRPKINSSGICLIALASGDFLPGACIFRTDGTIKQVVSDKTRRFAFMGEYEV